MKKRQGFVSNSSSSSFILVLPRTPDTVEDVHSLFFGEEEKLISIDRYGSEGESVNSMTFAKMIFDRISDKGRTTIIEVADELKDTYYDHNYSYSSTQNLSWEEQSKVWDENERKSEKAGMAEAKEFVDANLDQYITIIEVGDDSYVSSELEHGDILNSSSYLYKRISHH